VSNNLEKSQDLLRITRCMPNEQGMCRATGSVADCLASP